METNQIEIKDFTLYYDGIYRIQVSNKREIKACLTLDVILKMIQIEGYSIEDVIAISKDYKPLQFNKVILINKGYEDNNGKISLLTSELAEPLYMDYQISLIDFSVKE